MGYSNSSHHPAKFFSLALFESADKILLIRVTTQSKCQMALWVWPLHLSFGSIGLVKVEMQYFYLSRDYMIEFSRHFVAEVPSF